MLHEIEAYTRIQLLLSQKDTCLYMEQPGKGLSNDTIDSRTSNASSRDRKISTGFLATLESTSVFDDAHFHESYSQLGDHAQQQQLRDSQQQQTSTLWSHYQQVVPSIPSSKMHLLQQHCLPLDPRPGLKMNTTSIPCTNSLPPPVVDHDLYNNSPLFQFPSTLGRTSGKAQLWQKPSPTGYESELVGESNHSRAMASKLLDVRQQTYVKTGGESSSEVSPPAEKRRRSMQQQQEQQHPQRSYNFPQQTGTTPRWVCSEQEKVIVQGSTTTFMGRGSATTTVMGTTRELHSMEQLLVQCAAALEASDISQAQQTVFVMNNIAAVDGDPNQRLLTHFLKALLLRTSRFAPELYSFSGNDTCLQFGPRDNKLKTVLELTNYIDVMPWYRFGFIAANGAMLEAFEGKEKVHIVDFNVSHCMQWPTLLEALAERSEGPPQVRLTVCVSQSPIPPLLDVPYEELIIRLAKFARSKHVPFEYALLVDDVENLDPAKISLRDDELLAVNCLFRLHYVPEEWDPRDPRDAEASSLMSPRDQVLRLIRNLNPAIVTLTEEDAGLTSPKVIPRLRAAFNYLWIPFDALDTLLPKESPQRRLCEDEVAAKIENLVACEGRARVERAETKDRWVQRMRRAGFEMAAFSDDVVAENRLMLGEHSGCWGLRKDDDEDVLFLNWKGHTVSFATAWVPAAVDKYTEL